MVEDISKIIVFFSILVLLLAIAIHSDSTFWNFFGIAFVFFSVVILYIYIKIDSYRHFKSRNKNGKLDLKIKLAYFVSENYTTWGGLLGFCVLYIGVYKITGEKLLINRFEYIYPLIAFSTIMIYISASVDPYILKLAKNNKNPNYIFEVPLLKINLIKDSHILKIKKDYFEFYLYQNVNGLFSCLVKSPAIKGNVDDIIQRLQQKDDILSEYRVSSESGGILFEKKLYASGFFVSHFLTNGDIYREINNIINILNSLHKF